jgi:hypothetical protein
MDRRVIPETSAVLEIASSPENENSYRLPSIFKAVDELWLSVKISISIFSYSTVTILLILQSWRKRMVIIDNLAVFNEHLKAIVRTIVSD